jgi:hypothetical protein
MAVIVNASFPLWVIAFSQSSGRFGSCFRVGTAAGPVKPRDEYWHPAAVLAILIAERGD